MIQSPHKPTPKVTPRQWAVLGLLAAVLAGVLWLQLGGREQNAEENIGRRQAGSDRAEAAPPASRPFPTGTSAASPGKPGGEPRALTPWPTLTLAEAAAYDPFQPLPAPPIEESRPLAKPAAKTKPSQDAAQRKARQEQALAALRKTGVTAVLQGPYGATAIVGRRLIRVGDQIDGFRVVAIEPDGVVIKPATAEQGHEDQP